MECTGAAMLSAKAMISDKLRVKTQNKSKDKVEGCLGSLTCVLSTMPSLNKSRENDGSKE